MGEQSEPIVCGSRPDTNTDVQYSANQERLINPGLSGTPGNVENAANPNPPYNPTFEHGNAADGKNTLPPPPDYYSSIQNGHGYDDPKTALKTD